MTLRIAVQFCLVSALLLQTAAVRAQNLVVNGGFETGNFSGWSTNVNNVSGQVAAVALHSGSFGAEFSDSVIEGELTTQDEISQTFSTHAGTNYVLSFWVSGVQQSSLGAIWNGTNLLTNSIFFHPLFQALHPGWTNFQFVVQATSSSTLLSLIAKSSPGANNSKSLTYLDDISVLPQAGFNQVTVGLLGTNIVRMTFIGIPGGSYAVDRTFNLVPPQWTPLSTNLIGLTGSLVITNTAVANTNNFWRFRALFTPAATTGQSP